MRVLAVVCAAGAGASVTWAVISLFNGELLIVVLAGLLAVFLAVFGGLLKQ